MSIKERLDKELQKRNSETEQILQEKEKLHKEDKKYLDDYLEKNNIVAKLEEIVDWAREKGLKDIISEHRMYEERYGRNYRCQRVKD